MSNVILKEFGLEFIPLNQIGLSRVHFANSRFIESQTRAGLTEEVRMAGGGIAVAGKLEVSICETSEE